MKNTTRNKVNLVFSSFLVIGYIVCTFFFSSLASQVSGTAGSLIQVAMLVLFGLLLFYATRVGEGRQVRRFSLAVLLMLVLPSLYIIVASLVDGLPFHNQLASVSIVLSSGQAIHSQPVVMMLACVALGYGIPYTFLAGYEMKDLDEDEEKSDDPVVEGGLAQELAETEEEAAQTAEEASEPDAAEEIAQAEEEAEELAQAEAQAQAAIELQEIEE